MSGRTTLLAIIFVVGVFIVALPANAAITLQGPIMDGIFPPTVTVGGGSVIPLAQFMVTQSSGSDTLTKVGITLVADNALDAGEISRVSLWRESGTNPGFQINEDTFIAGAATTGAVSPGYILLTPTTPVTIGSSPTELFVVASTSPTANITNGHGFHFTAAAEYASTSAAGLGSPFSSSKVITLAKTATVKISEVKAGSANNTADEFIELYNTGETAIDLSQTPIYIHTFYANGSSTPVSINYFKRVIPAHGFFLVGSQSGYFGNVPLDAYFATTSFDVIKADGGVSVATSSSSYGDTATSTAVDFVGWGTQPTGNCEGTCHAALASNGSSLERLASTTSDSSTMANTGIDYMRGNGHDTNANNTNFYARTVAEPQNSQSSAEYSFVGGGGGGEQSGGALRVMGSYPGPGMTGVPVDLNYIGFGFNKPVTSATVNTTNVSFRLVSGGVATGSNLCAPVTYNATAGNMEPPAKCALSAVLSPSTSYVFEVTSGVTDLGSTALDQDSFAAGNQNYYATSTAGAAGQTFTNTIPPSVIGTSPFPGSTNVPPNMTKVSVEFNQINMDTATFNSSNITLTKSGGSATISNFSFSTSTGKYVLNMTLGEALSASTAYTLTVRTGSGSGTTNGVKNLNGVVLPSNYVSIFTTGVNDSTAPVLVGVYPTPGTTVAASTNDFVFTFDDSLDLGTVGTSTVSLGIVGGANLPGTVRYDPVSKEGHFTPSNVLPVGQSIRLTLIGTGGGDTIKNVSGTAIGSDLARDWTVEASNTDTTPPSIMFANGNEFELAVTYNESVNSSDATNISNYSLVVGGATTTLSALSGQSVTYDSSGRTARISGVRLPPSSFTVTATNVKDLSGNNMTSSSFSGTIMSAGAGSTGGMGFVGPGSFSGSTFGEQKDFSASGIGFMPPVEIRPSSFMVNASSTYTFGLPLSTQIPAGGQVVITFPSTADFGLCCAATTSLRNTFVNEQNKDINGPGPGTIGINSVVADSAAKTVTVTLSAATRSELFNGQTDTHDFLNFSIADLKNPSVPKGMDSSGYSLDIKSKNAAGTLLESFNANPVYIGGGNAGGGATTTIRGTVLSSYDSTTGLGGVTVHMMSPQTGMMDVTTAADGTYSFDNIAVGSSFVGNDYGGGMGNEYFINTDPFIDPTSTTTNYLGENMPSPTRATSTSIITKNITLTPADAANTASFTVHINANAGTFGAGEQLDIFAGGPGKFTVVTVTPGVGAINNDYTLYLPKVNGRWGIGIGPAMPKGGGDFQGPPPATNWAMQKPAEVMVNGCPTSCNFTVNGSSATSHIFTVSTADKTIAGKLQDASGNAISGAEIYAYSPTGGTGNHTQTAASGSFEIKVVEGSYNVGAFSPGMGQSKEISVLVSGSSYYINGSATAATADTFIIKMTKPAYTISGRVTDGANPVSTNIYAYRTDAPGHIDAMSDSGTGNYTLYVDNGTWKVGTSVPGFGQMTEQTVTVSSANQSNINFSPSTASSLSVLSGRVYEDTNGNNAYTANVDTPISGAVVRISGSSGSWNEGLTDSNGNYSIRVTQGTGYRINEVFHPTYNRIAAIGNNGTAIGALDLIASTTQDIKIPARNNVTVTIKDSTGAALSVNKAFVDIFSTTTRSGSHAEITNASTTVIQIPASSALYELRAFVQGVPQEYAAISGADESTVVTNNTFTVNGSEGIVITVNTATAPVRTIIGQVTAGGSAVGNAWVQFIATSTGVQVGTMATSSGWYSVALSEGSYQAVVSKPGYVGAPAAVAVSGNATQNLTLSASSRTITGSVTAGGVAAKDAFVRAEKLGGGHTIAKTDTSGAYTLNISEGRWRVFAAADGYAEGRWTSGTNDVIDTTASSQSDKNIALTTTVTVNSKLATSNTFTDTGAGTFNDNALGVNIKLDGNTLSTSGNNSYMTARETTNIPNTDSMNMIGETALDISAYSGSSQVKNLQSGKTATVELSYSKSDLIAEGITGTTTVDRLKVISYSEDKQEWESLDTIPTYYATDGTVIAETDVTANLANVSTTTFTAKGTHFSAYALSDPQGVNPPGTPTSVTATAGSAGSGQITVSWTAPTSGTAAAGYYIYRDTSASGSFALLADAGNVTSYTDTGRTAGTTYYYKIGAYASGGTLESSASDAANASVEATASGSTPSGGSSGSRLSGNALLALLSPEARQTYLASTTANAGTTTVTRTTAAAPFVSRFSRTLSVGRSGGDVTTLQTFLEQKGYLVIPAGVAKGYFGGMTKKALVDFQKENGIDPIGVFGPMTRAAVEGMMRVSSTATPAVPATPTTPTVSPNATASSTASANAGLGVTARILARSLNRGMSGEDVTVLQTFLEGKGYLIIPPGIAKGYFGPMTEEAVKVFQQEMGIETIGIVGPKTRAAIQSTTR